LKEHILISGDLCSQFDGVIILEDDLCLSPEFYQYAQQAFSFFKDDKNIAGIALYNPVFNETACCPFEPIHDGYDNYFMQIPCSWGQLWSKKQWIDFRLYSEKYNQSAHYYNLPGNVKLWPDESSWKKIFYRYLIEKNLFFVYPRIALSTNFGEKGEHVKEAQPVFQTPLLLEKYDFRFSSLSNSKSVYDGFYELDSSLLDKKIHKSASLTIDLNATKPLSEIKTDYLISSKYCARPLVKYSVALYPYELNILLDYTAASDSTVFFSFGKTSDFKDDPSFYRINQDLNRLFLSIDFLKDAAFNQLKKSKEYQLGSFLLKPIRWIKRLFLKNR